MQSLRSKKNIILISSNLVEVVFNIENVIPIKAYDGKKSKNSTLMGLALYLLSNIYRKDDVRDVIVKDFLKLSPHYVETSPMMQASTSS